MSDTVKPFSLTSECTATSASPKSLFRCQKHVGSFRSLFFFLPCTCLLSLFLLVFTAFRNRPLGMAQPQQSKPKGSGGMKLMTYGAWHSPADPTTPFTNKTVLATGADSALRLQTSIEFAKLSCSRLILGIRDLSKGAQAREDIERAQTGAIAPSMEGYCMSLSTFAGDYPGLRNLTSQSST